MKRTAVKTCQPARWCLFVMKSLSVMTLRTREVLGSKALKRTGTDHFELLDGLRGVAAICVFFYHSGNHGYAANGFLGVDFFFVLSGFVIAHSYEARLASGVMNLREFACRRFARLYPMVFVGVALGALTFVLHNAAAHTAAYPIGSMTGWIVSGLAVLPYPFANPFLNAVFPVNVVLWSLFLEVIANLVYALGVRFVSCPLLLVLITAGTLGVIWSGEIEGGGSLGTFWVGFGRVVAGFSVGLLLYRLRQNGHLPPLAGGLVLTSLAIVGLTFLPPLASPLWLPVVYLLFAAVIVSSLNVRVIGPGSLRLCRILGIVSYPLYLVHRPVTALTVGFGKMLIPLSPSTYPVYIAVALVLSVALSIVVERVYERRTRQLLIRLLIGKSKLGNVAAI